MARKAAPRRNTLPRKAAPKRKKSRAKKR